MRRLAAVWVPDWPVVCAIGDGLAQAHEPVALADAHRIQTASAIARAHGVRRGMRRRSAQAACPELKLLPPDPVRDVRLFEPIAQIVEDLVPGVELLRPGLLLVPARGASRYVGGDEPLGEKLVGQLASQAGIEASVGIADGVLAAILAARQGRTVPEGESPAFLAPLPIRSLGLALEGTAHGGDVDGLIDLLIRLGIRRLGDLAALPSRDVGARFGSVGLWAQRLVRARDIATATQRRADPEYRASLDADNPLTNVETAAFAARRLAEDLHSQLMAHGRTYGLLRIEAHTETGQCLERLWRLEGADAVGVAERVRHQLAGWIDGRSGLRPSGGLIRLVLTAQEVHPAALGAVRLWGDENSGQMRAAQGADRIQAMLGGKGVYLPVEQGGRDPHGRIRLVDWGGDAAPLRPVDRPWPGAIPDPAPATVPSSPTPVTILDDAARPVEVSGLLELSGQPSWIVDGNAPDAVGGTGGLGVVGELGELGAPGRIEQWAGPWPVIERWWTPDGRRRAFIQAKVGGGAGPLADRGLLLAVEDSKWTVEGIYD
ncbi:MAG: DNA polymerase Y family protein [Bifidobacteriaceae bacterium]|jgi:protein ImuB|nr:DNA polymerase Y family protein [Bifidobacteriaceae bacterium]